MSDPALGCRACGARDAVLDPQDPLPFLALHYGQVGPLCQTRHWGKGCD